MIELSLDDWFKGIKACLREDLKKVFEGIDYQIMVF